MIRAFILLVLVSLCSAGGADAAEAGIAIDDPWVRPTFGKAMTTAGYLTLTDTSGKGDTLMSVEAKDGGKADIHDTETAGDVMKMRARDNVPIPPGSRIVLRPGGLHIMVSGLTRPLRAGETFPMTLRFARQGAVIVNFAVRP